MSAALQIAAEAFLSLPEEEQVSAMASCRDLDLLAELDARLYAMCGSVQVMPMHVGMFAVGSDVVNRLSGSIAAEMFSYLAEDLVNGGLLDVEQAVRLRSVLLAANRVLGLASVYQDAA